MKHKLILAFLLIFSLSIFSQDSKFSVELNYPLTIDDNLLGRNYNGIVDAGLKFNFIDLGLINLGAGINASLYKNTKEDRIPGPSVNSYIISPKIYADFNIPTLSKLKPYAGVGYSVLLYRAQEDYFNDPNYPDRTVKDSLDGINLNVGFAFDLTAKLLIQVQYDFIRIRLEDGIPDFKYNTNVNILKAGLGFRL